MNPERGQESNKPGGRTECRRAGGEIEATTWRHCSAPSSGFPIGLNVKSFTIL